MAAVDNDTTSVVVQSSGEPLPPSCGDVMHRASEPHFVCKHAEREALTHTTTSPSTFVTAADIASRAIAVLAVLAWYTSVATMATMIFAVTLATYAW